MSRRLSARDRRALTAGAAILAPTLLLVLVLLPAARALLTARDTLATERALLDRERDAVLDAARMDSVLYGAGGILAALAVDAFDASEPQLAAVEVSRTAELIAELSGVGSVRAEPLAVEDAGDGWVRLRVRIAGDATFAGLVLLLHRIERDPSPLRVDQIAVRRVAAPGAAAAAAGPPDADATLAFTLVVQGLGAADRPATYAQAGNQRAAGMHWRRTQPGAPSEADLLASLLDDPFTPGTNVPGAATWDAPPVLADAPVLSIMGTVVLPDQRGLVMAQWGAEPPRLVRIGERIGGMRLRTVEAGAAEFEDETGSRLRLHVPKPGA